MGSRSDLHTMLTGVTPNVYFQPPENVNMQFPCIIYKREAKDQVYAGNILYKNKYRYTVTVVDNDPDSEIHETLNDLPNTANVSYDRQYIADGLYHTVYTVYY